jgi:hypothetical protein
MIAPALAGALVFPGRSLIGSGRRATTRNIVDRDFFFDQIRQDHNGMTDTPMSMPSITAEPPLQSVQPQRNVITSNTKRGVPIAWWAKIAAKIVLSRVMPSYQVRQKLGLFRHGAMDRDPLNHIRQLERVVGYHRTFGSGPARAVVELGPGDSVGMALAAKAMGMNTAYLIDVGDFASRDMDVYARLYACFKDNGYEPPPEVDLSSRDAMLKSLGSTYLTYGTRALADVPSTTIDVLFSNAVLEHVARSEFQQLMNETFRVMRPGAIAHHQIDLMDHLGGALNNLRFSERAWEGSLMSNSGFYTNRLRFSEILDIVKKAGFNFAVTQITSWPNVPTPKQALANPFSTLPDDELKIATFGLLLRKPD